MPWHDIWMKNELPPVPNRGTGGFSYVGMAVCTAVFRHSGITVFARLIAHADHFFPGAVKISAVFVLDLADASTGGVVEFPGVGV